jgi:hypothetical protein
MRKVRPLPTWCALQKDAEHALEKGEHLGIRGKTRDGGMPLFDSSGNSSGVLGR